jgi:hypothetical protein
MIVLPWWPADKKFSPDSKKVGYSLSEAKTASMVRLNHQGGELWSKIGCRRAAG